MADAAALPVGVVTNGTPLWLQDNEFAGHQPLTEHVRVWLQFGHTA